MQVCTSLQTDNHASTPPVCFLQAGCPWVSQYQKGKTNLDFTGVRDSDISWAICKSAPRSRQITTPVPHQSVFYRPDALTATQPTASKHWRIQIQINKLNTNQKSRRPKIQQNKTTMVQWPLTTLGQETRWAYYTTPRSPHDSDLKCAEISLRNIVSLFTNTTSDDITILHVNLTCEKLSIHCKMFCKSDIRHKLIVTLALL